MYLCSATSDTSASSCTHFTDATIYSNVQICYQISVILLITRRIIILYAFFWVIKNSNTEVYFKKTLNMKSCENPFTGSLVFTRQHINRRSDMHGETHACVILQGLVANAHYRDSVARQTSHSPCEAA